MLHAILIIAHNNFEHLIKLVSYFKHDCFVYIHYDNKQILSPTQKQRLKDFKYVKLVSQKFNVNWGGTSMLNCELYLLRYAITNSNADYFHLISGQDYPTRSLDHFIEFFKKNNGTEFLHHMHLPHPNWENNTFHRFQFYYPYDYAHKQDNPKEWVTEFVEQQKKMASNDIYRTALNIYMAGHNGSQLHEMLFLYYSITPIYTHLSTTNFG